MSIFRRYAGPKMPEEYSLEEALKRIKEGAEAATGCGYDSEKLHCKGCINSCRLSKARCDVGRMVVSAIEKNIHPEDAV